MTEAAEREDQGRVAIVTGGSAGLGEATVAALAKRGMRVAAVSRSAERLAASLGRLDPSLRSRVRAIPGNIGDEADAQAIVAAAMNAFGRLDVLVNCAGVSMDGHRPLAETSQADWMRLLETNLTGTFLICRAVLPHIAASDAGYIVNVLSTVAFVPAPGASLYAATKYGARAMTESLVEECRGTSVRVSSISPGKMNTAIWDLKADPPDQAARDEMLDPDDVAEVIAWTIERPVSMHIPNITVRPWIVEE